MSKEFRRWKIDEAQLLPPSVQDYVPKDHLSRLIVALVREDLDLSAIVGSYRSGLGQPPFDPRLMTALLLHGYASGLYSSRRIAKAAVGRADFMMIVAGDPPDLRTISGVLRRHFQAVGALFVPVLQLAEETGDACTESGLGRVVATCAGVWPAQDGERRFFAADSFFFLRVAHSVVSTDAQEPLEPSVLTSHRCSTVGTQRAATYAIAPLGLADLVTGLATGDVPESPVRLPWS